MTTSKQPAPIFFFSNHSLFTRLNQWKFPIEALWIVNAQFTKHINRANGEKNGYLSTDNGNGKSLIGGGGGRRKRHEMLIHERKWMGKPSIVVVFFPLLFFFLSPFRPTSIKKNKYQNYFNLFRFSLSSHHLLSFSHTSLSTYVLPVFLQLLELIRCSSKKITITCHCNGW